MAEEIEIMRDPFKGFEFPSEKEISKETKKEFNKIQAKDPAWQKAQREGAIKAIEKDPTYYKRRTKSRMATIARPIVTPYGEFTNQVLFNNKKFVKCTFHDCKNMMPHLYYYVDEGPGEPTYEEVLVTPYHVYPAGNNNTNGSWKDRAYNDAIKYNCVTEPKRNKDAPGWYVRLERSWQHLYYTEKRIKIEWYLEEDHKLNLTPPTAKQLQEAVMLKKELERQNRSRCIHTPHGVFDSIHHACDYYIENNIWPTRSTMGSHRSAFNTKLKNEPENYYLI